MQSINYFNIEQISNKQELKIAYWTLCKQHHPDFHPGIDDTPIKMINAEYEVLAHLMETEGRFEQFKTGEEQGEIDQMFMEMYLKVCHLPLIFELVGNWIWVTGDTRAHKETLKKAGFFWAKKKQAWYWRHASQKSWSSGKSLGQIKIKYGARRVSHTPLSLDVN
ncbi:hypothetical protein [Microscilla marina]|uniref:DnaJ domain protein n=1 Tax=Microscilla marina ATCC 23134 TaxID=313606 RepID=A1ZET3_MICM2|nr:hypothetical protein [Microscilla marina]EAY31035.1 DnaJ domain protein [Microscilla marina ATCC 23134]